MILSCMVVLVCLSDAATVLGFICPSFRTFHICRPPSPTQTSSLLSAVMHWHSGVLCPVRSGKVCVCVCGGGGGGIAVLICLSCVHFSAVFTLLWAECSSICHRLFSASIIILSNENFGEKAGRGVDFSRIVD